MGKVKTIKNGTLSIKETLICFVRQKGVGFPFTPEKIKRAGYDVKKFLTEIADRIKKADDYEKKKNDRELKEFIKNVNAL